MIQQVKRAGIAVLVAALMMGSASGVLAAEPKKAAARPKKITGNVAMVNGVAIKRADFERELFEVKSRFAAQGVMDPKDEADLKKKVLDKMIGGELLFQASKKKGNKVYHSRLKREVAGLIERRFPGDKEYKEYLERFGTSEAEFEDQVEKNLMIQSLISQEFEAETEATPEEAKDFYEKNKEKFKQPERVKVSHILIERVKADAPEADKKAAKAKIEGLLKRAKAGEDFAKLAQESSGSKDCDLGYFDRGETLMRDITNAAFGLKVGEISGIVETWYGYEIIKVTDKKAESQVAFDTAKEQIMQRLKKAKVQEALGRYVAELEKGAKVERLLK